ncbi:hypothetical protein J6590_033034 [Homalodisca vitripennis]|nr:hypothetical protein J6590_033034 [Homalodisca vitripennis]
MREVFFTNVSTNAYKQTGRRHEDRPSVRNKGSARFTHVLARVRLPAYLSDKRFGKVPVELRREFLTQLPYALVKVSILLRPN